VTARAIVQQQSGSAGSWSKLVNQNCRAIRRSAQFRFNQGIEFGLFSGG